MMRIGIVDRTGGALSGTSVPDAIRAVQTQVTEHFSPIWKMDGRLITTGEDELEGQIAAKQLDGVVYICRGEKREEHHREPVGLHLTRYSGVPAGFVFPADGDNPAWSLLLSHEVLEMLVDPHLNLLVAGELPLGQGADPKDAKMVLVPYEICDPVQDSTYKIGPVIVGNFCTPGYFTRQALVSGKLKSTNFLRKSLAPFHVLDGGYYRFFDPRTEKWEEYGERNTWLELRAASGAGSRAFRRERRVHADLKGWKQVGFGCPHGDC